MAILRPLSHPLFSLIMNFASSVRATLRGWKSYSGLSSRRDFWWFQLFAVSSSLVLIVVLALLTAPFGELGAEIATLVIALFWLSLFTIGLSLTVRRLRDAGVSWALTFLHFIPVVGAAALLGLALLPSKSRPIESQDDFSEEAKLDKFDKEHDLESKTRRLTVLLDEGKISPAQYTAALDKLRAS